MRNESSRNNMTHFVSAGNGEPLIFIHGVGLDHTMWQSQLDYFSSFYKVYAYDMIGHGQSEKPVKDYYRLDDFSNQLYSFTEMEQLEKAHIVGFSMGGLVAQKFSLIYPEKVKSLTIANSVANRNEEERKSVLGRVEQVEKEGKNSTIDAAINRWFSEEYIQNHSDVVQQVRTRLETNDDQAYLNAYRVFATADQDLWQELHQIQAPTFIITGENDRGSNPRMAKEMQAKIPNATHCIVPGAKHMLPVEKASIFNEHVLNFLKQVKEVNDN